MSVDLFNLVTDESIYTKDQFPQFYNDTQSLFVVFLQLYYQWLGLEGNLNQQSKAIMSNRDIDLTLPRFIDHFKKKYAPGIPSQTFSDFDVRQLIKSMNQIISEKGSTGAIKFVLQAALGVDSTISFPGRDVLKASQSAWNQIRYLELSHSGGNRSLVGRMVYGRQSNAKAYASGYQEFNIGNRLVCALAFTNLIGQFQLGEMIVCPSVPQDPIPHVVGSLTGITVYQGGLNFQIGQEVSVAHDPNDYGSGSVAVVSGIIPKNGVVQFSILNGGFGYANSTTDPTNFMDQTITLTQSNTNPGAGAGFQIGTLANTVAVTVGNDFVSTYSSIPLNAVGYGFPAMPAANLSTSLDNALTIETIEVGTISSLASINPGSGYNGSVNVSINSKIFTGLNIQDGSGSIEGSDAIVLGIASQGQGSITELSIKNSGYGYVSGEHVSLSASNNVGQFANGIVVLNSIGQQEGFWSDTNSFLDYPKYIQDSDYYQQFSYQINSSLDPSMYDGFVTPFHVSGTKRFGAVLVPGNISLGLPNQSKVI